MPVTCFSNRPLYLQLSDALAERIAKGEWKPHAAIPNEGDLAREFGVSPGTMRKALDLLEGQRLVSRRQGRVFGEHVKHREEERVQPRAVSAPLFAVVVAAKLARVLNRPH